MSTSHTQPTSSYAFSLGRKWSPSEKAVAHKAFDKALENELQAVIIEVKTRASKIEEPEELWELEDYLMKRRKEINRLYDYRYSVLTEVFGQLLRQGKLKEEDLQGLDQEKLESIRLWLK